MKRFVKTLLHNLLLAFFGICLAGAYRLAGGHFLQRIYRHEYQHLFPEGMESGAV